MAGFSPGYCFRLSAFSIFQAVLCRRDCKFALRAICAETNPKLLISEAGWILTLKTLLRPIKICIVVGEIITVAGSSADGSVRQGRQRKVKKHYFVVCHFDSNTLRFVVILCSIRQNYLSPLAFLGAAI